jgi:hypothetical protein
VPCADFDGAFRRDLLTEERVHLQCCADFFNISITRIFASPENVLSLPNFGQSTSMLVTSLGSGGVFGGQNPLHRICGPRSIQLALKLQSQVWGHTYKGPNHERELEQEYRSDPRRSSLILMTASGHATR